MATKNAIGPVNLDNQPRPQRRDPDEDQPAAAAPTAAPDPAKTAPAPAAPAGEQARNGLAVPDRQPAVSNGVPFAPEGEDLSWKKERKNETDMGDGTSIPMAALVRPTPNWRTDYVRENLDICRAFSEWLRMKSITTGRSKKMLMDDILGSAIPTEELKAVVAALYPGAH